MMYLNLEQYSNIPQQIPSSSKHIFGMGADGPPLEPTHLTSNSAQVFLYCLAVFVTDWGTFQIQKCRLIVQIEERAFHTWKP